MSSSEHSALLVGADNIVPDWTRLALGGSLDVSRRVRSVAAPEERGHP
jgi:hypothetical protein